jgi:hypothetical protein
LVLRRVGPSRIANCAADEGGLLARRITPVGCAGNLKPASRDTSACWSHATRKIWRGATPSRSVSAGRRLQLRDILARVPQLRLDDLAAQDQRLAVNRGLHAEWRALRQLDACLALELADAAAERRLRKPHPRRRLSKA